MGLFQYPVSRLLGGDLIYPGEESGDELAVPKHACWEFKVGPVQLELIKNVQSITHGKYLGLIVDVSGAI